MNRLTTKNGYYKITDDTAIRGSRLCGHEFATRFNELSKQFDKVLDKLAAYENTGLEPEEIKNLIKEYNKDSTIAAHYEQLEEQGLLIKLPCKVGQSLFAYNYAQRCIKEFIAPDLTWIFECMPMFGKEIFLTREEAEKALGGKNEQGN